VPKKPSAIYCTHVSLDGYKTLMLGQRSILHQLSPHSSIRFPQASSRQILSFGCLPAFEPQRETAKIFSVCLVASLFLHHAWMFTPIALRWSSRCARYSKHHILVLLEWSARTHHKPVGKLSEVTEHIRSPKNYLCELQRVDFCASKRFRELCAQ
jgi:hypothetical protein